MHCEPDDELKEGLLPAGWPSGFQPLQSPRSGAIYVAQRISLLEPSNGDSADAGAQRGATPSLAEDGS